MSDCKKNQEEKLFRFKQFSLSDSGCAMKIGTDGVLLGAYTAMLAETGSAENILDAGTGCGLIALMIAQKSSALIHAIDTDKGAIATATRNFSNSPWPERLKAFHVALQQFEVPCNTKFQMIVCNPPYFQNSMKSPDEARNLARHNQELGFNDLFRHSTRLLTDDGKLVVIYPVDNMELVEKEALNFAFFEVKRLYIRPDMQKSPKRVISEFCMQKQQTTQVNHLAIETGMRHSFTQEYRQLTFDYHPFFKDDEH